MIGGLGGFVCPILFGYLLRETGLWSSAWLFLFLLSASCLCWLHVVVLRIERPRSAAIEPPESHLKTESSVSLPFPGATR